jgi:NAD+ synthase (glutamine-hydrolysing)
MKIALIQQNYHIGNFEYNTEKIVQGIERAKEGGADLAVFSELSVCGYPPRDFLEFGDFITRCYAAIEIIKTHTEDIAVIIGSPAPNPDPKGKDLFNAAWFLHEKEVKAVVHKTCLPTYDIFDEDRYFEVGGDWKVIEFQGKRLAVTICEDIWNLGEHPLYRACPMDHLMPQQPDLMINISASPFDYDHEEDRRAVVRQNVLKYKIPMYYCNAVGSQTEIVFDGGSVVYDAYGNCTHHMKVFEEDFQIIDTETKYRPVNKHLPVFTSASVLTPDQIIPYLTRRNNIHEIHDALLLGIRDYFGKMGFQKAILGSSGGIDSAVTLALACRALGSENIRAVAMPSGFSSSHSVEDAEALSRILKNPFEIIPIQPLYESFLSTLNPFFQDLPFSIAEENIQSRSRGNLLMAMANKFGYILLNTSNKSELATGYGTLYGDMAGGLSVLGDLYKMQVYALAHYINKEEEVIPQSIINKAPSAELRPDQKDSDSLPDYDLLDKILYLYIERRKGPREIVQMGVEEALVDRVLKLVNTSEYKRNQFCPIIRVSSKAFGVGRRMPIVGKYLS